ncbi:neurotactin [Leptidea sinapis]|uniref:neurotactin n=1 Tax=Leptidea sinapis TaxID=189913 RepID=UPI0021C2FE14|nr:neurotactin [Leptidea sinapis]
MYFMTLFRWLLLICGVCGQVLARDNQRRDLDFENVFKNDDSGPARIRRYTRGRRRENIKKASDEDDDDPYNYKSDYTSIPKAFGGSSYSSPYTEKKDNEDYAYPYKYGSGYDHKEYDRIKELSEKQAAEIRENPGNCKEVKRDGMTCNVCKDPKTGGNYESCSYVAEPKNNKYAYSKERKFDSNDEPEVNSGSDEKSGDSPKKSEKYKDSRETSPQKFTSSDEEKPSSNYKKIDDDSGEKYKGYYVHTSKPNPSEALRAASDESTSAETKESKPYDYKKSLPGFYTDNEPKKDVEHVLAEFKKKDRSTCKKVQKNGMTCYQCLDKNGLKNEECMFVSESAPKQSHLAYQEVKEFTSKPATLDSGSVEAESQTITTSTPPNQKSAAYVAAPTTNGKKQKRKKATQTAGISAAKTADLTEKTIESPKVKRSPDSENKNAEIIDEAANIAPPEEFAGASSKGAFWAETMPRYSADLGVTLPEYMLSRSEHEALFDEAVLGA